MRKPGQVYEMGYWIPGSLGLCGGKKIRYLKPNQTDPTLRACQIFDTRNNQFGKLSELIIRTRGRKPELEIRTQKWSSDFLRISEIEPFVDFKLRRAPAACPERRIQCRRVISTSESRHDARFILARSDASYWLQSAPKSVCSIFHGCI